MNRTQLKLETVTPLFLHGYDSRILDLRPPPFKALFRYWWRATQVVSSAASLRDREGEIFGNTGRKSPLLVRLSCSENLEKDFYQPLPHHMGGRNCRNCPENENCKKAYSNEAYCPDEQFTIILTADNIGCYEKIAKLAFLLGGVGNRSRRGFGSIRNIDWCFADVCSLRREVLNTLNDVAGAPRFQINSDNIESTCTNFPGYPVIQSIFFGQPTKYVDSLLKNIGQATHDHGDDALGYAKRQERMASPIHVRIQKVDDEFVPVVTQLNSVFPPNTSPNNCGQKQQDFIDAILR